MANPQTLSNELSKKQVINLSEYFIGYQIRDTWFEKIEHVKQGKVVNSYHYTYKNDKVAKIIWLKFQDDISDRCQMDFTDTTKHTLCYYKSGGLYTEEWLNIMTTEYHFGQYDENGKLLYSENGSYSPLK
ncbi:hypothetical protein SanaruYs_30520 [Chryseotalea sanaruensis]|uniref:Uncharacterized protein n=1 Tax=Chryseotalea sanaruensis TaxID=2482724 RepID=A0A401UD60_9BACT|nr:hypothetical protein [Chryseotalea sanaruensis]GCC52813.1 hypothetical protein SanaruYs_30520 [Chryseotalea sanaruensis]